MPADVSHLRQPPDGSDCTRCGLCCTSPYGDCPSFVELTEHDLKQLPPGFRRRNVLRDMDRYEIKAKWSNQPKGSPMEGHQVHVCAAFKGALGKKCSCSIYEYRPAVCSDWRPRNETCRRIRTKFVRAIEAGEPQEALD